MWVFELILANISKSWLKVELDCLAVHELCHFHHTNNVFWNEVDKIMPNYRERKEWLKVNGAGWI